MAYNIVYKGECNYTGNYWHQGECVRGAFYYDDSVEGDIVYWVQTECGKKFANKEGMGIYLNYASWDDVLKDWVIPYAVKVQCWYDGVKPCRNEVGNCRLEEICQAGMLLIGNTMGIQMKGFKDKVADEAFITLGGIN